MTGRELCVIVGMGRGVSYGVARAFIAEGFQIAMVGLDRRLLDELERELGSARGFIAEASDEAALRTAFDEIRGELGDASVLVYNVSGGRPGAPLTLSSSDLEAAFRINVTGALIAAQQVVPSMRASGRGTILLTGGGLSLEPKASLAAASVGKAALRSLTFSLAEEVEPAGIHVATVTICGFVEPGSRFSPERIGVEFMTLHRQPPGGWEREIVYR